VAIIERRFAEQFAEEWIAAWNSHDLDRILAHYADDFAFSSLKIVELMSDPGGMLPGKDAIRRYWAKALARTPDLKFEIRAILIGVSSVVLHYKGSAGRLAAEVFEFGEDGLVKRSSAHYVP